MQADQMVFLLIASGVAALVAACFVGIFIGAYQFINSIRKELNEDRIQDNTRSKNRLPISPGTKGTVWVQRGEDNSWDD